ncbi:MAG: FecR domain-containing protein, partial [Chloroflexota bacterium]
MIRHSISFENLADWLDDRLDPEASRAVRAHLDGGCSACETDLAWLRRIRQTARTDDTIEPAAELVARTKAIYRPTRSRDPRETARPWSGRRLRFAAALTAFFIVAVGVAFSAYWPTLFKRDGRLTAIRGTVEARPSGDAEWRPVSLGDPLCEGNRVRASDGTAVLVLFDGTTLQMELGSEIVLSSLRSSSLGGSSRIAVQQRVGSVRYDVIRLVGGRSVFLVQSPTALVTVRGTSFVVTVESNLETRVAVLDGIVEVAGPVDSAILTVHEVAVIPANAPVQFLPTLTLSPVSEVDISPAVSETTVSAGPPEPSGPTKTPQPPGLTKTPQPPGLTKTPQPPGLTKTPQPPGLTRTPQPPGLTNTPQPPGLTKTPQPPGLTKTPQPPGLTKTPQPPGLTKTPQ